MVCLGIKQWHPGTRIRHPLAVYRWILVGSADCDHRGLRRRGECQRGGDGVQHGGHGGGRVDIQWVFQFTRRVQGWPVHRCWLEVELRKGRLHEIQIESQWQSYSQFRVTDD